MYSAGSGWGPPGGGGGGHLLDASLAVVVSVRTPRQQLHHFGVERGVEVLKHGGRPQDIGQQLQVGGRVVAVPWVHTVDLWGAQS